MNFRSFLPLISVALLATCLPLGASELNGDGPVSPEPEAAQHITLSEVLRRALAENIGLQIDRIAPANAYDVIEVERAAFDPRLVASYSLSERQAAASSSALDNVAAPFSENRQTSVGADQRFSMGTSVGVDTGISRTASNNNAARNPDYASDVGLTIRQPLMRGFGREVNLAPLARARIGGDQAVDRLKDAIMDLMSAAEVAYWNLAFAKARRDFFLSSLDLAEKILEENRERQRLGLATPLEVLQAEAEVVSRQEELILAEQSIEDAVDRLIRVMGDDFDRSDLRQAFRIAPLPSELLPTDDISVVTQRAMREDLRARAQERQVEIQRLNRLVAGDDVRPDLDLTLGLRYLGRDSRGPQSFRGAYSGDGYNVNAGIQVSMPWDFRAARARERQAVRNLEREELALADLRQERAITVRETWRTLNSGLKRIEVTRLSVRLNEQTFEQERARFSNGTIAFRQVLEAQRDLDQARLRNLSAIIETLRAEVRLARLDGTILDRNGFSWDADILRIQTAGR